MEKPIYLDHNATTPLDPRVLDAMMPYFQEEFGNPSSQTHSYGWVASAAVEKSRKQTAQILNAEPSELYWTSGATESNNLAILGLVKQWLPKETHLITSQIEHKSVLEVFSMAEKMGTEVTYLPVNSYGQVEIQKLRSAIKSSTRLISVMAANNEVGTLNPLAEIGQLAKEFDLLFHTDAAQAVGKIPIDVRSMGIHLLSLSGHKIYGPKGVGALFVSQTDSLGQALPLQPLMVGGSQEKGLRPGTLNVPAIVGLGCALEIASVEMESQVSKLCLERDRLIQQILHQIPGAKLNGHPTERLCNNVHLSFQNICSSDFALGLSGLAYSSGSACNSLSPNPSHVLKAMGVPAEIAKNSLRLGLGRFTRPEHIDLAIEKILKMAQKSQERAPINVSPSP